MTAKISIIVPIFNSEKYLKQCVESILRQTYQNIELILIDDDSPDNCGQICDDYAKLDDRIVVIHQENKGVSDARNNGLEVATGDYIGFVDSDDWIDQEMYEVLLNLLIKYDLDIVECGVNDTGFEIELPNTKMDVVLENSFDALQRIIKYSDFSVWRRLYKSEIIKDARFLPNRTSEDVYFTIENISKINKMGYFGYPFYNYRSNPTGITKSRYNIIRFNDSISASLFVEKELRPLIYNGGDQNKEVNHQELYNVVQNFMLNESFHHYKMLNYYPEIDPGYAHRKKLKELIDKYYFSSNMHDPYLRLANLLSIKLFTMIIYLNKIKNKLFRIGHYS